jgi:hypothetical protein
VKTFGTTADPLLGNGYNPIPIVQGEKRPAISGWETPMSPEQTRKLAANGKAECGTGLLLAMSLGDGTQTGGLDVDVYNEALARHLHAHFPQLNVVRVGQRPKWLALVRVEEGMPELRSAKYGAAGHHVQLLGRHRQCVLWGTHPDTGKPYRWPQRSPLEVAAKDLPFFSLADWERLCGLLADWAAVEGWEQVAPAITGSTVAEDAEMPKPPVDLTPAQVRDLVWRFRDDRRSHDPWVHMGMALHHQSGGAAWGKQLWIEWSGDVPAEQYGGFERWETFGARANRAQRTLRSYLKRAYADGWRPELAAAPAAIAEVVLEGELQPLDLQGARWGALAGPQWIVQDWLPAGAVTLLAGDGGSGKSYVSLVMAVQLTANVGTFAAGERQRVLYYSAEDPAEVLLWRVERICSALMIDPADLAGWLFLFDATSASNVLFTDHADPSARLTARYDWLAAQVKTIEPSAVVLDNASDLYDASEVDRAKVRQFVTALNRLARLKMAAVLLLSHLDKAGAKEGGDALGYSGSTAWNNSVRARLFLYRDGEQRVLALRKSNWGAAEHTVPVTWSRDLLTFQIGATVAGTLDDDTVTGVVWGLLREVLEAGDVNVSVGTSGNRTVYGLLARTPGWPKSISRERVQGLVKEFAEAGLIVREEYTMTNRKRAQRWVLA